MNRKKVGGYIYTRYVVNVAIFITHASVIFVFSERVKYSVDGAIDFSSKWLETLARVGCCDNVATSYKCT